jgi:hypothetical protein
MKRISHLMFCAAAARKNCSGTNLSLSSRTEFTPALTNGASQLECRNNKTKYHLVGELLSEHSGLPLCSSSHGPK